MDVPSMVARIKTKAYPQFRMYMEELERQMKKTPTNENYNAVYDLIEQIKKDLTDNIQPLMRASGGKKTYRKRIGHRRSK